MRRSVITGLALAVPFALAGVPAAAASNADATVSVLHGVPGLTVDVFANGEERLQT